MTPGNLGTRLVVLASNPVFVHETSGLEDAGSYFNPDRLFSEVFVLGRLDQLGYIPPGLPIIPIDDGTVGETLRAIRPDVIRVHAADWTLDMACRYRMPDVPVIASVDYRRPNEFHRSIRYADQVWCMSEAAKQSAIRAGVHFGHVRMLSNRVDREIFHSMSADPRVKKIQERFRARRIVLHIGERNETKNPDTVIRALLHLPNEYHAVFIGRNDASQYVQLTNERGLADRCHFVEDVTKRELPLWCAAAACLCVPSRWETVGNQILEAAACGTPIIASDIPPINELLTNGVSAHLLADYENPLAVAKAIRQVVQDEAYRRVLSTGAAAAAMPFDHKHVELLERKLYFDVLRLEPHRLSYDEIWWRRAYEFQQIMLRPGPTIARWLRQAGAIKGRPLDRPEPSQRTTA